MTQRQLILLCAASLVVLVLAVWVTHREQSSGASLAGVTVLTGLQNNLNAVTAVRITGPHGQHVTLVKGAQHWMVSERGYPADSGTLRKLLIDLGNLKVVEPKTRLAQNYPILGVQPVSAPGATGVRIDIKSPRHTWSLIVGHSAEGSQCYVRRAGHKQSLLATPLILADAKPAQWLDPIIVDVGAQRVRRVEERLAGQRPYRIERTKATQSDFTVIGMPRGRKLASPSAADTIASALSNLTLTNVHKAVGAPQDARVSNAVFTTFDGLELTVSGYRDGKNGPYDIDVVAHASGTQPAAEAKRINADVQGWTYEIPPYAYQQIFQPLSGLLQPLPVPYHRGKRHRAA